MEFLTGQKVRYDGNDDCVFALPDSEGYVLNLMDPNDPFYEDGLVDVEFPPGTLFDFENGAGPWPLENPASQTIEAKHLTVID